MKYISTRGTDFGVTAKEAILRGLAPDGGLYVPECLPVFDNKFIEKLSGFSYIELAKAILGPFLNFTEEELKNCVEAAYSPGRFRHDAVAPVVTPLATSAPTQTDPPLNQVPTPLQDNIHFLELFHGPTLAFKDMALSILPHLLKVSASDEGAELAILTATSGDTGKAALEAFSDVEGVSIVVFYPEKGVSSIQKRQMITQEGDNTYVFGVEGNFDDAQTGVKKIFSDPILAQDMAKMGKNGRGIKFSSANSINIGRLLPQIVYYFYAYGQLNTGGNADFEVNFVVPTENFGNILAGYYAKRMGLPIRKLICASNDNKVLYDFFKTGTYDKNREFFCTISPSMDILVSSNLERLLFHATDGESVREMMEGLAHRGNFKAQANFPDFYGIYITEAETRQAIFEMGQKGYIMDPHTAVAYHAGQRYIKETNDTIAQIVISTASPYKFGSDVMDALGEKVCEEDMKTIKALSQKSGLPIPEPITQLAQKPIRHTTTCTVNKMEETVRNLLTNLYQ